MTMILRKLIRLPALAAAAALFASTTDTAAAEDAAAPVTDYPTYSPISAPNATLSSPCLSLVERVITDGPDPDSTLDEMSLAEACCEHSNDGAASQHPYCAALECYDPIWLGIVGTCDCAVGIDYYDLLLPDFNRTVVEDCCSPGRSFEDAVACAPETGAPTAAPDPAQPSLRRRGLEMKGRSI